MAGPDLSRVSLKLMRLGLTVKASIQRDNELIRVLNVSRVIRNPLLKRLTWDANRSTDANAGQLAGRDHREHLRSAKTKQLSDVRSFKQQWFQSTLSRARGRRAPELSQRHGIAFE